MRTQKDRKLKGVWKNETESNWNGVTYERSNGRKKAFIKKKHRTTHQRNRKIGRKNSASLRKFSFRLAAAAAAPELLESRRKKNYRRSTANRRENRLDLEAMAKRKRAKGGRRSYD
jgi:predicted DNA-binding WGR domain protein